MASPAPPRSVRRAVVLVLSLTLAVGAAGCGGGSSDAAGGSDGGTPTTSAATADDATADGASEDPAADAGSDAEAPDLDLCAEVTAEDIGSILTEADISDAAPNPALDTPTCQYFVDWAGSPLSLVQITWNQDGYLDALRQSNPTATELDGADGVAVSETSIVVAGASGDFQIDGGVEQTDGGAVATQAQLLAIAELVEGR